MKNLVRPLRSLFMSKTEIHSTRVTVATRCWQTLLRQLLDEHNRCVMGWTRRMELGTVTHVVLEAVTPQHEWPNGARWPSLADWCVVAFGAELETDANVWQQRLQPRPGQHLTLLLLGLGPEQNGWLGWHWHAGECQPVAHLDVPGAGLVKLDRDPPNLIEHELEPTVAAGQERWSRTVGVLGPTVQNRLRRAAVLLVGASRSGSALAWQLAALGVRRLWLVDPDVLELSNLNATWGLTPADLGRPKVIALAEKLLAFRPDLAISAIPRSATHPDLEAIAATADLIVSCVDRDAPRLRLVQWASRHLRVHLDVGVGISHIPGTVSDHESARAAERRANPVPSQATNLSDLANLANLMLAGDVRLMLPHAGCLCCVGGLPDEATARRELALVNAAPLRTAWQRQRAGSLITLNSLAVAIGVQLWLDLLADQLRSSFWARLRWLPGHGLQVDQAAVTAATDCGFCNRDRTVSES